MARRNLPNTARNAARQAREQAKAYDSLLADIELTLDDGTTMTIPPHPELGMLDDERLEAYEDLLMEVETYDREEDIFFPEQRLRDPETGKETGVVLPSNTQKGALKRPYRINGVRVKPAYSIKVVQVCLGEVEYKRLTEGGLGAKDVWRAWGRQSVDLKERQSSDPKSDGSTVDLEAVPSPDSE